MEYVLSTELFHENFFVNNGSKFKHLQGVRFKLFPYVTHYYPDVRDLDQTIGGFLCRIEEKKPGTISVTDLVNKLKEETEIEPGREELFSEVVKHMFFDKSNNIRPINLCLLEQIPCNTRESKIADYLVDVLGEKTILKTYVEKAKEKLMKYSNVFERLVITKLDTESFPYISETSYFKITESLQKTFEEDFVYILSNPKRTGDYLLPLVEFYFFSYTAQTCMQLNRFFAGERDKNIPLFFSLEWEKTSQSRKCFTEGWQYLQKNIENMFAHAVVLEILNQTIDTEELFDYIKIGSIIEGDSSLDIGIATQISKMTECYREAITDCPDMMELGKKPSVYGESASEVHFLFECVRTQFEIVRSKPYNSYANNFENYCHKYLKSRGRSGLMLNLSEETLIFLTKICIKDFEQLRLKDVFKGFEDRGVFLDDISREQVADYYEKLNLIEKKSDSGDAKYVKRIL